MRAYLPISHLDLLGFLAKESFDASEVFAPTESFINENLDCDEEEIEYLLSISAGEAALDLRTTSKAPGLVLAVELNDSQCGQSSENLLMLIEPLTWNQVQCALLLYPSEEELVWFATQEIELEIDSWI